MLFSCFFFKNFYNVLETTLHTRNSRFYFVVNTFLFFVKGADMSNNQFHSNQRYFTICIYTVFVILAACIIFRLLFHWNATVAIITTFISHMSSFVIGILIAFMVNPLVNYIHNDLLIKRLNMQRKKLAQMLSITISYLIVLGFIAVCLVYVIPQLISSLSDLSANIPQMFTTFSFWLRRIAYSKEFVNNTMINNLINNLSPKIMELSTTLASKIIPWLYSASISFVKLIITIIISLVVSIYLLADKKLIFHTIKKILYAFLPVSTAKSVIEIGKNCNQIFTGYIVAKAIDSLIIGILCCIIMSILNLPYSVLVSVIVGVTNMIPYFGPYIGAIPGVILLTVLRLKYGIIFLVMIICLQQFDGLILGPRLLGDSTGLRPILILFAITIGGAYMGIIGMFLGVPVIAVLQYLLTLLIDKKLKQKNITV